MKTLFKQVAKMSSSASETNGRTVPLLISTRLAQHMFTQELSPSSSLLLDIVSPKAVGQGRYPINPSIHRSRNTVRLSCSLSNYTHSRICVLASTHALMPYTCRGGCLRFRSADPLRKRYGTSSIVADVKEGLETAADEEESIDYHS